MSGKFQLKGHSRVAGLQNFNVDGENQYMRGQKRDVTYVSRLQVSYIQIPITYVGIYFIIVLCVGAIKG